MLASELRKKDQKELLKLLTDKKVEQEKSVSELLQGKSKNTNVAKKIRKEVARIKTVLQEQNNA